MFQAIKYRLIFQIQIIVYVNSLKENITRKVAAASLTKRISNHFYPFFIMILTLLLFSLPSTAMANGYTDVTVSEAKTMIDSNLSLVVLDVRTQSEYDFGHIRNAKLIPDTELESRLDELDINDEILVYCESGVRSSNASNILADHGFLYVHKMLGGIIAWINEGYPVYVKYSSIQEAINSANEGDTIRVSSGKYNEHVVVNKTVNLVGENCKTTIIDGNGTQTILELVKPNVNVSSFTIRNGTDKGVYLTDDADSCMITRCKIENNSYGIFVKSNNSLLTGNIIVNSNISGILIYASCGCSPLWRNIITENNLSNNYYGVQLINSVEGQVYHNNFINNTYQAYLYPSSNTTWDNGYPSGGNYWSTYKSTDIRKGPNQEEPGSDGIGDVSYTMFAIITDNFPLMAPISKFDAYNENGASYSVDIVSNSTISDFYFNPNEGAFLRFNVTGEDGTIGFCRVTIPKNLLWVKDGWNILVGSEQITDYTIIPDENYAYLYFIYHHSTKTVEIRGDNVIPEFPSAMILLLTIVFMALVVAITKKTWKAIP